MNIYVWARVATILLLLAAVGPWPYDYFTLMRFVVCSVTARGAYLAQERARTASTASWRAKQQRWAWVFALIAILFNPFVPVRLNRSTWTVIDVGAAVILIVEISRSSHEPKTTEVS